MDDVVGVCFKPTGKVYYFAAQGLNLQPGEQVIAETSRGQELAEVVCRGPSGERAKGKLKPILRRATERDVTQGQENRHREEEARRVCQRLLKQMELAVKLVDVEYAFDGTRITFSFASDDKTDFRELQRRLKEIYDCEVDVRQIGVRDQAKILGGLGPCGRHLCCAAFLRSFQPVTIRMAKDQDIALNPTKISGQCGRLMCCLRYEHDLYRDSRGKLPRVGAQVQTPEGSGEVTAVDVLQQRVTVATAAGPVEVSPDEVGEAAPGQAPQPAEPPVQATVPEPRAEGASEAEAPKKRRRRGSRKRRSEPSAQPVAAQSADAGTPPAGEAKAQTDSRRRRGRRRRPRRGGGSQGGAAGAPGSC
jgi:cell fate regulator YaaT (PSP1 superfamily)